jgi:hypothetical protein
MKGLESAGIKGRMVAYKQTRRRGPAGNAENHTIGFHRPPLARSLRSHAGGMDETAIGREGRGGGIRALTVREEFRPFQFGRR